MTELAHNVLLWCTIINFALLMVWSAVRVAPRVAVSTRGQMVPSDVRAI